MERWSIAAVERELASEDAARTAAAPPPSHRFLGLLRRRRKENRPRARAPPSRWGSPTPSSIASDSRARSSRNRRFASALDGHRSYQGGRGSGYDVAASLYGGFGLFVGGRRAFVRAARAGLDASLLPRPRAGSRRYRACCRPLRAWKRREPAAARSFLEASNGIVRGFAEAEELGRSFAERLREGARLAAGLGERSAFRSPRWLGGRSRAGVAKALGAGDELWALWPSDSASVPEESEPSKSPETSRSRKRGRMWSE